PFSERGSMTGRAMKLKLVVLLAGGMLCAPAANTSAQGALANQVQETGLASVRLRLRQQDNSPVIGAEVSIKGDKIERVARSDSSGMVSVEGLVAGSIEIRVRRIGLKQAQLLARIASGDNEFTIDVDGTSVMLADIRVVGSRRVVGRLEDFEMRLRRGDASAVVTEAQLDKRNPVKLSTMLRGMPGLRLADSLGNIVAISTRGKKLGGGGKGLVDCVFRMSIDGIVLPALSNIDQLVPRDVYGVEVFNGPSRIPVNMGGMRQDSWCGLIAIWTKSG
ncbi:MAG: carboxypeptidase-like regulatory domain-containing protein, partial [Gemmatimonadaceae bacterium]